MFRKPIITKSRWSQFCLHIISLPVCLHWERKHSAMSLPADKFLVTSLRAEVPGNPESGTKKTFLETSWLHTVLSLKLLACSKPANTNFLATLQFEVLTIKFETHHLNSFNLTYWENNTFITEIQKTSEKHWAFFRASYTKQMIWIWSFEYIIVFCKSLPLHKVCCLQNDLRKFVSIGNPKG